MSPVSSSSSFSRQQRAQPSHRLSHSALDISSNVLVFQKNPSWLEGGLDRTVMFPEFPAVFSASALLGVTAAMVQGPVHGHPMAVAGIGPAVQNRSRSIGLS